MQLRKIGIWTSYRSLGEENAGEAARLVESLGFGVFWFGGSPKLPAVRPLLEGDGAPHCRHRDRERMGERARSPPSMRSSSASFPAGCWSESTSAIRRRPESTPGPCRP